MDLISYVRMYSGAQSMEIPKFQDMLTLPQSGGGQIIGFSSPRNFRDYTAGNSFK